MYMKARKKKQRKNRIYNIVGFRELLLRFFSFFFFAFQLSQLIYNVCLHLISKLTIKRILSFSLTPRATPHNNNNKLTFAILEYESPF